MQKRERVGGRRVGKRVERVWNRRNFQFSDWKKLPFIMLGERTGWREQEKCKGRKERQKGRPQPTGQHLPPWRTFSRFWPPDLQVCRQGSKQGGFDRAIHSFGLLDNWKRVSFLWLTNINTRTNPFLKTLPLLWHHGDTSQCWHWRIKYCEHPLKF